jgi:hypothetical protein
VFCLHPLKRLQPINKPLIPREKNLVEKDPRRSAFMATGYSLWRLFVAEREVSG